MAPRCIDLLWSQANYLDLEEASRINRLLEVLELLDRWRWLHGTSPIFEEVWARLLALGRIEKEGRQPKRRVELIRIQPKADPGSSPGQALGGTFSFSRAVTSRLIRLGIRDARQVLEEPATGSEPVPDQIRDPGQALDSIQGLKAHRRKGATR